MAHLREYDSDPEAATRSLGVDTSKPSTSVTITSGQRLGRYVMLELVGEGGMGRVVRAYDPKLQREVALKLVSSDATDAHSHERTLREARAMAQLSHPNVVAVYDAEETKAGIVVVMEYVAGVTLRHWARAGKRTREEIVAHYLDAGRGLAAAHAVELLHRDFKPANVLVADSGAVKVTDFGLAKRAPGSSSQPESSVSGQKTADALDDTMTEIGTAIGTPRYMAPEQHRGDPLDATVDQYAFCIALWEALVGEAPFQGRTARDIERAKLEGPPAWPSRAPAVPRVFMDALRRGLAVEPVRRWPGMNELLEALAHDPAKQRNRWLLGGGGLAVAGLVATSLRATPVTPDERCTGAADQLAGHWDDSRREEVRSALLGVGAPYVEAAWSRTETALDDYAREWVRMHTESCEATSIRGEQSAAVMDLRMGCLRRARSVLGAVTKVLGSADDDVAMHSNEVLDSLPALERCADVDALRADVEPPRAEDAEVVRDIRVLLAEARAEREAGRYPRAQQALTLARSRLDESDYGPVHVDVALEEGELLDQMGQYDEAETALRSAWELASRWRQWDPTYRAALGLMVVVGVRREQSEAGLRYWEQVSGLAEGVPRREAAARSALAAIRLGQGKYAEAEAEYRGILELQEGVAAPDLLGISRSRASLGHVLSEQDEHAEAEAEYRRALGLAEGVLGPDHPHVASLRSSLGRELGNQGKHAEAEASLRRALAAQRKAYRPDHPDIAKSTSHLASLLLDQGKREEAEAEQRRALALLEASLDSDHPATAKLRTNLAAALYAQGKHEEAEAQVRQALASMERRLGADHPNVAQLRGNLALLLFARQQPQQAEVELRAALEILGEAKGPDAVGVGELRNSLASSLHLQGRFADAEVERRRALVILEEALGPGHQQVAAVINNLAADLHEQGKLAEAEVEYRRALATWERALGPEHPEVAHAQDALADYLFERNELDEALRLAELAWKRRQQPDIPPAARADTAFLLAQLLWKVSPLGEFRKRAAMLARLALGTYEELGTSQPEVAEVRAWMSCRHVSLETSSSE